MPSTSYRDIFGYFFTNTSRPERNVNWLPQYQSGVRFGHVKDIKTLHLITKCNFCESVFKLWALVTPKTLNLLTETPWQLSGLNFCLRYVFITKKDRIDLLHWLYWISTKQLKSRRKKGKKTGVHEHEEREHPTFPLSLSDPCSRLALYFPISACHEG